MAWQTPKTDWTAADGVTNADLNRIEGNIAELKSSGNTTATSLNSHINNKSNPHGVTKSQVGLGNVENYGIATQAEAEAGSVNNKYMTPLRVKQAVNASGTSAATANRLVVRDANGRAKFAQGANAGDAVVYPVPVTSLKRAQGTMSGSSVGNVFAVHQYAFASPLRGSREGGGALSIGIIPGAQDYNQSTTRQWVGISLESSGYSWGSLTLKLETNSPSVSVTWDYLTASGHPRVWAALDDLGEIVAIWEAEDPADQEWPDEPPFEPEEGLVLIQVEPPDEKLLEAAAERLERAPMPQGFTRSIYAADQPPRAVWAMFARQLAERALEEPSDIRDVLSLSDRDRRYWYLQLWLRQASRILHNHRSHTLIPLYQEMCRVDRRTGRLVLR